MSLTDRLANRRLDEARTAIAETWLPVTEAANRLGVTRSLINNLAMRKSIPTQVRQEIRILKNDSPVIVLETAGVLAWMEERGLPRPEGELPDWITLREARERCGLSRAIAYRLYTHDIVASRKEGRTQLSPTPSKLTYVHVPSIEHYLTIRDQLRRRPRPEYEVDPATQVGATLRAWRTEKGWSQVAVAEAIGVEKGAISAWERGVRRPSLETVLLIGDLFGIDPSQQLALLRLAAHEKRVAARARVGDRRTKAFRSREWTRTRH